MKHLEESNATNVAEMEEEADLADVEKAAKKEAEKQAQAAAECYGLNTDSLRE